MGSGVIAMTAQRVRESYMAVGIEGEKGGNNKELREKGENKWLEGEGEKED